MVVVIVVFFCLIISYFVYCLFVLFLLILPLVCFLHFNALTVCRLFTCCCVYCFVCDVCFDVCFLVCWVFVFVLFAFAFCIAYLTLMLTVLMCDGTAGVRVVCVWTCVASAVVTHAVAARDLLLVFILFVVCTHVYSFPY